MLSKAARAPRQQELKDNAGARRPWKKHDILRGKYSLTFNIPADPVIPPI
ncbi:hypothetical protein J22TS3_46630 [Paenibacillus sp. J22TS3]|nr:hypothetical protein J22TS3_46630 [Paenibacillus sp. J22TS3]